jgi:WD40 repeat protein
MIQTMITKIFRKGSAFTDAGRLWRVFICYRRSDGSSAAELVYRNLSGVVVRGADDLDHPLDIYFDQTAPAIPDWRQKHLPHLRVSRALIFVATPMARCRHEGDDWVHMELDWWVANRKTPPIIVNATDTIASAVPKAIQNKWPYAQRIECNPEYWRRLPADQQEFNEKRLAQRITEGIRLSETGIRYEELLRLRKLNQRLLILLVMVLLAALGIAYLTYSVRKERDEALTEQSVAVSRQFTMASGMAEETDPELSILFAANAISSTWIRTRSVLLEAERRMHDAMIVSRAEITLPCATWCVAWSPDGKRLATGGMDSGTVWDVSTGKEMFTLPGHDVIGTIAWSPDGKRIAGNEDKTAIVWDASDGKVLCTMAGQSDMVRSVAWSPDSSRLVTGSADWTAMVWDSFTGRPLLLLPCMSDSRGVDAADVNGMVNSVAWSPDGRRIATAQDKWVFLWDAASGRKLLELSGHEETVNSVAWSPNGEHLATAGLDNKVMVWDSIDGKMVDEMGGHSSTSDGFAGVAWSPRGDRLAVAGEENAITLWWEDYGFWGLDPVSKHTLILSGHHGAVVNVVWSPDGTRLASASGDGTVKIWNSEKPDELPALVAHSGAANSVAWSPDGKKVASGGKDTTAKVWDVASGQEVLALTGHTSSIRSIAWSHDGKRIATGSEDDTAIVWDVDRGKPIFTLHGEAFSNAHPVVKSVDWSPDGKGLVTANNAGPPKIVASVWNTDTGQLLFKLPINPGKDDGILSTVDCVAWSPDGRQLATAVDGQVKLWDASNGNESCTLNFRNQLGSNIPSEVAGLAWSPDSKQLVACSGDGYEGRTEKGSLKVWNVVSGIELLSIISPSSTFNCVSWSPDGRRLATGMGASHDVKIWDAESGQEIFELSSQDCPVIGVAWSPDSSKLAAACDDGTLRMYEMDIPQLVALARHRITAPFWQEGCQQYLYGEKCPSYPELK